MYGQGISTFFKLKQDLDTYRFHHKLWALSVVEVCCWFRGVAGMPNEQTPHIPPEEEGGLNFLKSLDRFALVEGIFPNARRRVGDWRRGV